MIGGAPLLKVSALKRRFNIRPLPPLEVHVAGLLQLSQEYLYLIYTKQYSD
jgi:hypothetical protein